MILWYWVCLFRTAGLNRAGGLPFILLPVVNLFIRASSQDMVLFSAKNDLLEGYGLEKKEDAVTSLEIPNDAWSITACWDCLWVILADLDWKRPQRCSFIKPYITWVSSVILDAYFSLCFTGKALLTVRGNSQWLRLSRACTDSWHYQHFLMFGERRLGFFRGTWLIQFNRLVCMKAIHILV